MAGHFGYTAIGFDFRERHLQDRAMTDIRVYVPTYRRAAMLQRALNSLQAQTYGGWVCEVHNDDPSDPRPAQIVHDLNDPRITMAYHPQRLGAHGTFNLFFQPIAEPYLSILEDDNLWEPGLLSTLRRELAGRPDAGMAWCNQKFLVEQEDGSWLDSGRTVNARSAEAVRAIDFGDRRQITGALHANGAMLMRTRNAHRLVLPADVPFAIIEFFRERLVDHPIVYVDQPLAWYSVTRETARSKAIAGYIEGSAVLAATFLKCSPHADRISEHIRDARHASPPETGPLLAGMLLTPGCWRYLKFTKAIDWLRLAKMLIGHPSIAIALALSRVRHPHWWTLLETGTRQRFDEATKPEKVGANFA